MSTPLPRALLERELLVCVGSGGVGKTTTAATLGLQGALAGRKVLVLTIDPARRLANSLGLQEFGNQETRIELTAEGELWAMMLDTQTTFDELIQRMAPDTATAQRILNNRIYRTMSDTFAGSQDYMAAEKLHDVVLGGRYDLVVLDTPPVKNALDFFEAPGRLSRFFDKRIIKWFLQPFEGKRPRNPLVRGPTTVIFRLLGFVFGSEFLDDLSEFLVLFKDMVEGFRLRHERVQQLFRSQRTSFLTVCAPTEPSVEVASFFTTELRKRRYPRGGVIVNQVHRCLDEDLDPAELLSAAAAELGEGLSSRTVPSLLARLGAAHKRLRQLSQNEQRVVAGLKRRNQDVPVVEVPWLETQVHDLEALGTVGDWVFGEERR